MLVGGVFMLGGCQMPFKVLSRAEFSRFRELEELNKKQGALISSLLRDKEALESEVLALKAQLKDKTHLLALTDQMAQELKERVGKSPGLAEVPGTELIQGREGIGIRVGADVFFAPGQASLRPEAANVLEEIAKILQGDPDRKIRICGYSDSDPIKVSGWDSNYQLSGARALSVLEHLNKQGVPASRLHFAGFGEHALIRDDSGKEIKKRSRRVEIILLYETVGTLASPVGAEGGSMVPK